MTVNSDQSLDRDYYYQKDLASELDRRLYVIVIAFPLLVLMFWVADWIFAAEHAWLFLGMRLTIIPIAASLYLFLKSSATTYRKLVAIAFYSGWPAGLIAGMIFIADGTQSIYRHGIILVALCSLVFIPFRKSIFFLSCISLYLPFFVVGLVKSTGPTDLVNLTEYLLLVVFVTSISFHISRTKDKFRLELAEVSSKKANELNFKEELIDQKSDELFNLQSLSHQFSPNIIAQMELGNFSINQEFHEAEVCAIFIGIQDFSDRVLKLDKGKTKRIIDMFINDALQPLVSRNITIDKFEGDKILAFSNQPIEQNDFVERVCEAALEIKSNIKEHQEKYERLWRSEFHLKFGISVGRVTVGFFGKEKSFQTYSAIGYPLPKAARLTSISKDSKILVDERVKEKIDNGKYRFKDTGLHTLKGFDDKKIEVLEFERRSGLIDTENREVSKCKICNSENSHLEQDNSGFFIFVCKDCDESRPASNLLKKAG
ncbi:adenylate/guanylate cyclase domain-containing protein [Bdellovibrionales bacterium]|nr:adenylate/guanylate cyclase domain-containing protein [Bdellovibrionales bacterium]